MLKNDSYTIRKLLDYSFHQNYHNLISIDLPRQTNTSIAQQINLEKLEEYDCATSCFTAGIQQKAILNFTLDLLNVTE